MIAVRHFDGSFFDDDGGVDGCSGMEELVAGDVLALPLETLESRNLFVEDITSHEMPGRVLSCVSMEMLSII